MAEHCCNHDHGEAYSPPPLILPKKAEATLHRVVDSCCSGGVPAFDGVDPRYKRVLWTVIVINAAMFFTEMVAGKLAGSQALQADALDFLADTVTYGLSLAVIGASLRTRATAALFKGFSLSVMALWVSGSTLYQTLVLGIPSAEVMGVIGFMALAANLASVGLLLPYKDGDANVRSVWLCSQRCRRQCDRHAGRRGRLGNGNSLAGSDRRCDHGRNLPQLIHPDTSTGVE